MECTSFTSVSEIRERHAKLADRLAHLKAKYPDATQHIEVEVEVGMMEETFEYNQAKESFVKRVSEDLTRAAVEKGAAIAAIGVYTAAGRRFDKVQMIEIKDSGKKGPITVIYFIHRETGAVFGAKSPLAPNLKHYYGTIYEAEKWDWSGERAVPLDETLAGVKKAKAYGGFVHYVPTDATLYNKLFSNQMSDERIAS